MLGGGYHLLVNEIIAISETFLVCFPFTKYWVVDVKAIMIDSDRKINT